MTTNAITPIPEIGQIVTVRQRRYVVADVQQSTIPLPTAEIGGWDRCKYLACGKNLIGFSIAEHTQSEHQGKYPGYRKMRKQ